MVPNSLDIIIGTKLGRLAEWSNAVVLKTIDLHGSEGSNPSSSATIRCIGVEVNISVCHTEDQEFESPIHRNASQISSTGRAPDLYSGGYGFDSYIWLNTFD